MGEAPMTRRALASLFRAVSAIAAALVVALVMSGPAAAADAQQTAFGFGSDWKAQFNYSFAESPYDPAFDDSGWETMQAPFGNGAEPRCGFPAAATDFPENSYLVARKRLTLPAGGHSLQLTGTIDNYLWGEVNGNYVGDAWNGDCQQFGFDVRVPDDT